MPFTAFAEPITGGNQWFTPATGTDFFAGLHVSAWSSVRKVGDGETTDDLFGFLTCDPNELVALMHPKAKPVILTEDADLTAWLDGADARELQRPCPVDVLRLDEEPQ